MLRSKVDADNRIRQVRVVLNYGVPMQYVWLTGSRLSKLWGD